MLRRPRRDPPPEDFNVNGSKLSRLSTGDLYDCAEASIMMAGYHLSEYRNNALDQRHLGNALAQAETAVEALRALLGR